MTFDAGEFGQRAADLRYAANKPHGDEIEIADGTAYRECEPVEWLGRGEIEELIERSPEIQLVLIGDFVKDASIYRVQGDPLKSWRRRLSEVYITDDGYVDQDRGWALVGCRWATAAGAEAVVFRVEC